MNLEQLETVWQVIRAVEKSITTAGKTLTAAKYESTKQWADALHPDRAVFLRSAAEVQKAFHL